MIFDIRILSHLFQNINANSIIQLGGFDKWIASVFPILINTWYQSSQILIESDSIHLYLDICGSDQNTCL